MKNVFALLAVLGMSVAIVGCGETKKPAAAPAGGGAAPATTPAAPAAENK